MELHCVQGVPSVSCERRIKTQQVGPLWEGTRFCPNRQKAIFLLSSHRAVQHWYVRLYAYKLIPIREWDKRKSLSSYGLLLNYEGQLAHRILFSQDCRWFHYIIWNVHIRKPLWNWQQQSQKETEKSKWFFRIWKWDNLAQQLSRKTRAHSGLW